MAPASQIARRLLAGAPDADGVQSRGVSGRGVRWLTAMDVELPEKSPDGWTVVAASGEIDVASAATLRDRLIELINEGSDHLILDLDGVDFIDSTGLGVLVGAVRRARAEDGDMRLVCSNARLLKVFAVTGLDEVFVIADSADEAAAEAGTGSD